MWTCDAVGGAPGPYSLEGHRARSTALRAPCERGMGPSQRHKQRATSQPVRRHHGPQRAPRTEVSRACTRRPEHDPRTSPATLRQCMRRLVSRRLALYTMLRPHTLFPLGTMRTTQSLSAPTPEAQALEQWSRARYLEALRMAVRRELRVHKGPRALADEMGIHRNSLRKFVDGQSEPWPGTLARIERWAGNRPAVEPPNGVAALFVSELTLLLPVQRPHRRVLQLPEPNV